MSYLFLGAAWKMVSPWHVGRLAMIFISVIWVFSIHRFASYQNRPVSNATLACVFLFSSSLYWGFLNFLLGMPVFLYWYSSCKSTAAAQATSRKFLFTAGHSMVLSMLLFYTHPLWFAAALVWLAIFSLQSYKQMESHLPRIIGVIPVGIFALIWFPRLNKMGFSSETMWGLKPWDRIFSGWVFHVSLGGLTGFIEPFVLSFIALWIAVGLIQNRRNLRDQLDKNLLLGATMFVLAALLLPYNSQIPWPSAIVGFLSGSACSSWPVPHPPCPRAWKRYWPSPSWPSFVG